MRLYFRLLQASFQHLWLAKSQFVFRICSQFLLMILEFCMLLIILGRFHDIGGWNLHEIAVLYGLSSGLVALGRMILCEFHSFDQILHSGEFDNYLIRPVSPLFLLLTRRIDWAKLGGVLQALAVFFFGVSGLSEENIWYLLTYLPILLPTGLLVLFAMELSAATLTFWTGKNKELQPFLIYAPSTGLLYPLHIYPDWLQTIFLTILPIGWVNYFPLSFLLSKSGASYWLWLAPIISAGVAGIAIAFWNQGVKRYASTGS